MTRHSKNCTASSVYSYHEKKKDTRASGFGTLKERIGKGGVKDFDCCSLGLHPCREPVITPDGYIYEKEAILEYIVAKKAEYAKKLKEYEKQCNKEKNELEELGAAEERSQREKFFETESSVSSASRATKPGTSTEESSVSNMNTAKAKKLPSFWIPSLTPHCKDSKTKKPEKTIYCPMSGKPLKMKDLINVKFTLLDDKIDSKKLEGLHERYKCPVSGDILRNNITCAVLKPTGDVITQECVDKIIKKDMIHPLTGQKLSDKDIIILQRGGTGYAITNDNLVGAQPRPVMQV